MNTPHGEAGVRGASPAFRPCPTCGTRRGHLLLLGALYCRRCFPAHMLTPVDRFAFVMHRCRLTRIEIEADRRGRIEDRKPSPP